MSILSSSTWAAKRVAPTPEPGVARRVRDAAGVAVPKNAQNRLHVSMTPPHACVKDTPSSCGNVSKKCSASLREGRGPRRVLVPDPAAVVVHRVVAAPQHPVIAGQPEVVELVAQVGRAAPGRSSRARPTCAADSGSVIST